MFLGRWVGSSLFRNNPDDDQQRRSMRDTFWCDATRWRGISCFVLVTYTIFLELFPKHQIVRKGICFISWSEFLFWLYFTIPISWSSSKCSRYQWTYCHCVLEAFFTKTKYLLAKTDKAAQTSQPICQIRHLFVVAWASCVKFVCQKYIRI